MAITTSSGPPPIASAGAARAPANQAIPGRTPRARRSEALAGYLFVAVPMVLFLVLNIGALLYAIYISVWQWNLRTGPVTFLGLKNYQDVLGDPTFQRAIQNSIYYALVWVPLTMAIGLFLAIIVNQKIRGRTFFRASFYFPAIASSAAITTLWIFIVSPTACSTASGPRYRSTSSVGVFGFPPNQNWIARPGHGAQLGHHPQRLDDVGHVHAVLPGLAPVHHRRGLRGRRDRRRGRVADVPADHVPAAAAGPLLRGHRRGHRGAAAVRPGGHRRRRRTATRTTP